MTDLRSIFFILIVFSVLGPSPNCWAQEVPAQETEALDFAQGLLERGLYDMASTEYEKFIAAYPQSTYLEEAYLAVGESYFLAEDFPKAVDAFNHFKELYPNSEKMPQALLRLGEIYVEQNKFDEALKELTSIDTESRLKGQMLQSFDFFIGRSYRGKSDQNSALQFFEKATGVADASTYTTHAFEQIAEIQREGAHYNEAVEAYTKAAESAQDENRKGYLLYKFGETRFLSGNYDDAIKQFRQVLEQYPAIAVAKEAVTNLLLAYFNLAQNDQVLTEYQSNAKFIKDEDPYFDVHFSAARAFVELKKYDEALALLEKILTFPAISDEHKRKIILKKADVLIKQKKYQEGLALAEGPLPAGVDDTDEINFLKAQGYYGLNDFEKASIFFKDVSANKPDSPFAKAAILGIAYAYQETGKFKEALDNFLQFYNTAKDEALRGEALYGAAIVAVKLNDTNEAIAQAQEYLKTFPNGAYYEASLLLLGDLYEKTNQSEKAVSLLQEYLTHPERIQKPDAVFFLLGFNQQILGQADQAIETYSKIPASKDDPKFFASGIKNTAVIYLSKKKDSQAAAAFDRLIMETDANSLEVKTYLWVCDQYLEDKKFNDVLRIVEKGEKYFPDQNREELAYFKAEASRELKDFDNAQKFYDVVLTSAAKNMYTGAAHIGKGLCFMEMKKFDEAKAEFQKAIDENPDDHTVTLRARFELGNIANEQKNLDDALKFYLLVGTIYEDDDYVPQSLLRAAGVLESLSRKDEALKLYKEILAKYKDSPVAASAQERMKAF